VTRDTGLPSAGEAELNINTQDLAFPFWRSWDRA